MQYFGIHTLGFLNRVASPVSGEIRSTDEDIGEEERDHPADYEGQHH